MFCERFECNLPLFSSSSSSPDFRFYCFLTLKHTQSQGSDVDRLTNLRPTTHSPIPTQIFSLQQITHISSTFTIFTSQSHKLVLLPDPTRGPTRKPDFWREPAGFGPNGSGRVGPRVGSGGSGSGRVFGPTRKKHQQNIK